MAGTNATSSQKQILRIARKIPGVFFYAKIALSIFEASRMSRIGNYTLYKKILSSLGVLQTLEHIGVDVKIENMAAIRNLKIPCVFVGNHMSVLETFIFPCLILPYRKFTFVLKKSLTEYPIFKHIIQSLNPIVVDRINPREDFKKVLMGGLTCLKKNTSVLVFPQTTRSLHFNPTNFNSLGVKLAKRGNVPVVPVAVKTDAWGIGKWLKDIGRIDPAKPVRISFGDPVYIQGNGKKEHRIIIDFISSKLADWGVMAT
jgi:1-acyl-sn-glycerol-3-phosphate acyltransferase